MGTYTSCPITIFILNFCL